jgi:hypothetical protein
MRATEEREEIAVAVNEASTIESSSSAVKSTSKRTTKRVNGCEPFVYVENKIVCFLLLRV